MSTALLALTGTGKATGILLSAGVFMFSLSLCAFAGSVVWLAFTALLVGSADGLATACVLLGCTDAATGSTGSPSPAKAAIGATASKNKVKIKHSVRLNGLSTVSDRPLHCSVEEYAREGWQYTSSLFPRAAAQTLTANRQIMLDLQLHTFKVKGAFSASISF
jgi:hypothetical protein